MAEVKKSTIDFNGAIEILRSDAHARALEALRELRYEDSRVWIEVAMHLSERTQLRKFVVNQFVRVVSRTRLEYGKQGQVLTVDEPGIDPQFAIRVRFEHSEGRFHPDDLMLAASQPSPYSAGGK